MAIATIAQALTVPGGIAVNLGRDATWENEWAWTPVNQSVKRTINGECVAEFISPNTVLGRKITLNCGWLRRSQINGIITLRDEDAQTILRLTLVDGRTFAVLFDHEINNGAEIENVLPRAEYTIQVYPNWYITKVHFIVISDTPPAAYAYVGPEEPLS